MFLKEIIFVRFTNYYIFFEFQDFIVVMAFYVKFFYLYTNILGLGWTLVYYEIMR